VPAYEEQDVVVGNDVTFTLAVKKDGALWDITGGTVLLYLRDPAGNWSTAYSGTIVSGPAGTARYVANETVIDEEGEWALQWSVTVSGTTLRTVVETFTVQPFLPGVHA
jgi:hypothetical protein